MSPELDPAVHLARAERHQKIGALLAEAGDEWAAVPLFYSAYHLVRHALKTDPIFDQPDRLARLTLPLVHDDRYTTVHKTRGPKTHGGSWGLNDLVGFLYPATALGYELLHQASNEVRYGAGLISLPVDDLVQKLSTITAQHGNGEMVTKKGL